MRQGAACKVVHLLTGARTRRHSTLLLGTLLGVAVHPNLASAQATLDDEPTDVAGRRSQPEFTPIGIPAGAARLYPKLEIDAQFDNNILLTAHNPISDLVSTVRPSLAYALDLPNTKVLASAGTAFTRYASNASQNGNDYLAAINGKQVIDSTAQLGVHLSYSDRLAQRGTLENDLSIGAPLTLVEWAGGVDFSKQLGRGTIIAKLNGVRTRYDDITLPAGPIIDQGFRAVNQYGGSIRAIYSVTPAFSLYTYGELTRFNYKENSRDATDGSLLAGVKVNPSRLFSAEFAVGYQRHDFHKTLFPDFGGVALQGSLRWYPTPLASVSIDVTQRRATSTLQQASAVSVTDIGFRADYEVKRNLILSANAQWTAENYKGLTVNARRFNLGGSARYLFNRNLEARLNINLRRRTSSDALLVPKYSNFAAGAAIVFTY